jgi:hypothetical protein
LVHEQEDSYLRKLAKHTTAMVGMLLERTKMEYAAKAVLQTAGMGGALPGPPAGLNPGPWQSFCCNSFCPAQKWLVLRMLNSGMSLKDATLGIGQECVRAVVDADTNARAEDYWYAANNGLGSPRHLDDEDGGALTFADLQGDMSGGALGESAKMFAKAKRSGNC